MPDWFYRTLSQPILFSLPAQRARDLALGFMSRLQRLPLGSAVIDFLGHMRADERLRQSFLGIDFPTGVGLGPWLDTRAVALPALARFGLGFLEAGPVMVEGYKTGRPVTRFDEGKALRYSDPPDSLSLIEASMRLAAAARQGLPLIVRLGYTSGATLQRTNDEHRQLIRELCPHANLFSLSTLSSALAESWPLENWDAHLRACVEAARESSTPRPLLLCVRADDETERIAPYIEAATRAGVSGLVIDGSVEAEPEGRWV
ncbi:MAG: hypothetical protein LC731_05010 [Acidobacteria bacterium]|nr:hypothetical protein [Acidobacteriota bacterium]